MLTRVILAHLSASEFTAVIPRLGRGVVLVPVTAGQWTSNGCQEPAGIVWELSHDAGATIQPVSDDVLRVSEYVPLLLRVRLTAPVTREIARVSKVTSNVHISLRGIDSLEADVQRLLSDGTACIAEQSIIGKIERLHPRIRDIVVAAAVAGRRRVGVKDFASFCEMPVRTLEWRLQAANAPTARRLLGWMVALHTAWRMDGLGWPLKRAALAAGFSSPEALGNYIQRHAQMRPVVLCRAGFGSVLDSFMQEVAPARQVRESPSLF